jgi:hypothetical protein
MGMGMGAGGGDGSWGGYAGGGVPAAAAPSLFIPAAAGGGPMPKVFIPAAMEPAGGGGGVGGGMVGGGLGAAALPGMGMMQPGGTAMQPGGGGGIQLAGGLAPPMPVGGIAGGPPITGRGRERYCSGGAWVGPAPEWPRPPADATIAGADVSRVKPQHKSVVTIITQKHGALAAASVGLYTRIPVDPQLESAWFHCTLNVIPWF